MNVTGNFAVWEKRTHTNEKTGRTWLSVRVAESRKTNNTERPYETINSFWANVYSDAAISYINGLDIPAAGERGKRAPLVHLEGALEGKGIRDESGKYGEGFVNFFRAGEPQFGNGGSNAAPAQAAPAGEGFMEIPEGIDEELPFN